MSMDLTGITNKNEYYTNHYFSTVFEENTRATISGWNAAARESEEIKTPWSLLRQNARQYYTAHDKFVRSSVNLQVLANIKALVGNYLKSLGYPEAKPEVVAVDDSLSVPVYLEMTKSNGARDINTAMYESTKLLQSAGRKPRYASIIIDEGQDFSDNAYRLIRALAGEEHPNDIFIVGDSHQRIYRNYPTLSKCGINVRGRSSILKINYRTTEEIRKHAFALLNGISFDDLDEDLDLGDKCQSLTHGEKPIVENFENANDEFDFLLREVKKLKENGVSLTDICVVARTKKLVDDYIALFTRAGIRSYAIKRNKVDDRSFDGLRVATMHRVKGLEFKYVFIAAVNNRIIPLPFAINKTDAVSEVESITSEKCLLYVAMTRAQKGVYITSYGRPSEFLV